MDNNPGDNDKAVAPSPASTVTTTATVDNAPRTINVRILSPILEATSGIELHHLAVDTTLALLRQRICDHIPQHPPPDRQRLIFQGRLLTDDNDTLESVFGHTAIQLHNHFTLHLVVRQPDPRPQSRTNTPPLLPPPLPSHNASIPPPQPAPAQANLPPLPQHLPAHFRQPMMPQLPGFIMAQMPGMPPTPHYIHNHALHPHHPAHPHMPPTNTGHAPTPPTLQGLPTPNAEATPQTTLPFAHPNPPRMMPTPPPNLFQNLLNRHQQERAALGQLGVPRPTNTTPPQQSAAPPPTGSENTNPADPSLLQSAQSAQNPSAQTPTMLPPNATRYTVTTVNRSTFAMPPIAHQLPFQQNMLPFAPPHFPQQLNHLNPAQHAFHVNHPPPQQPPRADVTEAFDHAITAQEVQHLAELTAQYAAAMQERVGATDAERQSALVLRVTSEAVAERVRNSSAARTTNAPQNLPQAIPTLGHHQHPPSSASRIPSIGPSFQNAPQSTSIQGQQFDATAATVYLLSSPTGPHGLLFAPQGTYTTNLPHAHSLNPAYHPFVSPNSLYRVGPTPTQPAAAAQPAHNAVPDHGQHQAAIAHVNQQANQIEQQILQAVGAGQQPDQQVDVLQQWQPLLAQAWLLLRIMLFTWILLGTGQGWRRPMILLFIGVAFWLLNGGVLGRGAREAVQAWWEGVVAVPRQGPPEDAQARPQPAGGEAQQQQAAGQPAPPTQQYHNQQQQHQQGWLRQTFRPAERALALFIASLWPGLGERTVAARREEDNRLRRLADENRAREETLRLQNEEASAPGNAEPNASGTDTAIPVGESSAPAVASGTDVIGHSGSKSGEELRERKPTTTSASADDSVVTASPSSEYVSAQGESAKDE